MAFGRHYLAGTRDEQASFHVLQHAAFDLAAADEFFSQQLAIVPEPFGERCLVTLFVGDLANADGGALAGRLDEDRKPERTLDLGEGGRGPGQDRDGSRDRQAGGVQQPLGDILVESSGGAQNAAAGKRHARHLRQPLRGTVLAMETVQDRKQDVDCGEFAGRSIGRNGQHPSMSARHQTELRAT